MALRVVLSRGGLPAAEEHDCRARLSRSVAKVLGLRLTLTDRNHGAYNDGPYIFALMNQTSLLEPLHVTGSLPQNIPGMFIL